MAVDPAGLHVPVSRSFSWLVRSFVREIALHAGAGIDLAQSAADDAERAWQTLCAHSNGERARISTSLSRRGVETIVALRGAARFAQVGKAWQTLLDDGVVVRWRESGIDGWELRIVREHVLPTAMSQPDVTASPNASGEVTIRLAQPLDAAGVGRCFLAVYGHAYPHTEVFSPRRFAAKLEDGELISTVAIDATGEVVGHLALEREAGAPIAERGEAVVLPAYRGRGLLEKMTADLFVQAQERGLSGIFATPVTVHVYSQHGDERCGMPICAVQLGVLPEGVHPKDMPIPAMGQRQSLLYAFKFLAPQPPRTYAVPARYAGMVAEFYAALGVEAERMDGAPLEGTSVVDVSLASYGTGRVAFARSGADAPARLEQARSDMLSLGAKAIELWLPLGEPACETLAEAARAQGFYFAGIGPAFAKGRDVLMMQLCTEPVDTAKLQLFTDLAKRLVAFVDADRADVATAAGSRT